MSLYEEMDTLNLNTQTHKPNFFRYLNYNLNLGTAFRTLELALAALFLAWSFLRSSSFLSDSLHLLSSFLRRLSSLSLNPHFVFLLGNSIIAALFLKFYHFNNTNTNTDTDSSDTNPDTDTDINIQYPFVEPILPFPPEQDPVEKLDNVLIEKEKKERKDVDFINVVEFRNVKICRRSGSEVFDRKKVQIKLRRSETEPRRSSARREFEDDGLSNEEFRRKVEDVIERHRRSLREESSPLSSSVVIIAAGICA